MEDAEMEPRRPRRPARIAILLVTAALLLLLAMALLHTGQGLLEEAKLRGERGASTEEGYPLLSPGERARLDLSIRGPAAVVIYLEDPEGKVSEVHPPPGVVPLIAGPRLRLPPPGEAWETGGLDRGWHTLWVLAGSRPIASSQREAVKARLEEMGGQDARPSAGEGMELTRLPFLVE